MLYGLDADLFMLGLATHEVHFTLLREEVLFGKNRPCNNCRQSGDFADRYQNEAQAADKEGLAKLKHFIFANMSVLREYLDYELRLDLGGKPTSTEGVLGVVRRCSPRALFKNVS